MRELLRDEQWEAIAPMLDDHKITDGPSAEDRRALMGILWVLRTGVCWEELPADLGPPYLCRRRLQEWRRQGMWERIWPAFLGTLDEEERREWSRALLEGRFIPRESQYAQPATNGKAQGGQV